MREPKRSAFHFATYVGTAQGSMPGAAAVVIDVVVDVIVVVIIIVDMTAGDGSPTILLFFLFIHAIPSLAFHLAFGCSSAR